MGEGNAGRGLLQRLARFKFLFVIAALVLAMAACGNDKSDSSGSGASSGGEKEGGSITIEGQQANAHGEADVTGKSDEDVEIDDFYFEPTVLKGEPGQKITLHLENEGDTTHNFSITDQNIDTDVDSGDDADVDVTFPQSGTVMFFCKFHQGQGMLGGLQVAS